jgi:putative Mg2+ transporter-C (MgtC) family protein
LWPAAAIDVSAGVRREATVMFSTLLALGIFSVMPRIVKMLEKKREPL